MSLLKKLSKVYSVSVYLLITTHTFANDNDPRAREVNVIPGYLNPGEYNAITDVAGVLVGQVTLVEGESVRTGVTAILPHGGNIYQEKVPAGFAQGNGYGKMMGTTQVIELGELETPVLLTNTLSVADVASGVIDWTLLREGNEEVRSVNAVVGETNDGWLNDIRGRHVKPRHAIEAIEIAKTGPVEEGSIGAGTGTINFGWKGGIGTSSRVLPESLGGYTVGVLVQTNYGNDLKILGIPVNREIRKRLNSKTSNKESSGDGSVMIIIATDAPVSDRNLTRMARRAFMGIANTGSTMSNGSGDYALAFSTAESVRRTVQEGGRMIEDLPNSRMTPLFQAVTEATEEAVYNALFKASDVQGNNGNRIRQLPVQIVLEILREKSVID